MLAVALTFAVQTPALAHAELVRSDPPVGATLDEMPDRVRLEFDEQIEAEFNPVLVEDAGGDRRVDLDDARVDPDDPNTLTASLGELSPGSTYLVEYRVISADGDPVEDRYTFYLSNRAVESADPQEPDGPVEGTPDEGFGRFVLYGGLVLAAGLALGLAHRLRQ